MTGPDGPGETPALSDGMPPGTGEGATTVSGSTPVRHTARWIALGVLVVAAGLIAVLATRPPAAVSEVQSPLVGHPAPPVGGVTVTGSHYVLTRPPGRYVVLNFFASWCVPCQEEGPNLVQFAFEHQASESASVVSVVFDDTASAARSYQAQIGATWPTLADSGGALALSYGVRAPPSTFVIAPDGRVVAYVIAPVTAADLDRIISQAEAQGA